MTDFPPYKKPTIYEDVETTASNSTVELPKGRAVEYQGISKQVGDIYQHVAEQMESEAYLTYYQARMPTLAEIEESYILDVLKATDQNKTKAAKILGIAIKTLYNKLHEYGQMPKKEIFPDYDGESK